MSRRANRRSLAAHLSAWSAEQIAASILRRPDLVVPEAPGSVQELAQRAQQHHSIAAALDRIDLAEDRLLQVVVCCQPDVPIADLARALPDGVALDDVEPLLASLEAAALLWRHDGRVHSPGMLRQVMPTTLGPPVRSVIDAQTTEYLKAVIDNLRTVATAGGTRADTLPGRATGQQGRPPRKADLVDELESLLVHPELVVAVVAAAPPEARDLAVAMAAGQPAIELPSGLYYSRYEAAYRTRRPEFWLYAHGAMLPSAGPYGAIGVQPREVGLALRGGRPVATLPTECPPLAVGPVEPNTDRSAASHARHTLDVLADLLARWSEQPATTLKNGGLGVTVVRQTASALDVDTVAAERLVELAYLAGLIDTSVTTRKVKRQHVHDTQVGTSPAANDWLRRPLPERWRSLATAWLRADYWPSASGQQPGDAKAVPVLTPQWQLGHVEARRREVLGVMAGLDDGEATSKDRIIDVVYWRHPRPWLSAARGVDAATAIGWVYEEAEWLGFVAGGALSTFGRALLDGDHTEAEQRLTDAMPAAETTFTLQADLTAVVVGALDREVLTELRLLADAESTGGAAMYRFSDSSIRRAIDAGRDTDSILDFLGTHSPKGVPQPLATSSATSPGATVISGWAPPRRSSSATTPASSPMPAATGGPASSACAPSPRPSP